MAGKATIMEKKEYKFVTPGLWGNLSADDAMAELERIREKRGQLKPEYVVEESKDENAILHNIFQWDDTIAAQKWREHQASALIRNITITVSNEMINRPIRAIVNVASSAGNGRSYIPITEAIHDKTAYEDLLAQAKSEMESFLAKYQQIEELNPVKREMLMVLNGIKHES